MRRVAVALGALLMTAVALPEIGTALAQSTPHPFAVPGSTGGASGQTGLAGWILAKQVEYSRLMARAAGAIATDASALWTLIGLAFAYGVFHAAGPGHGKAIVAGYVMANERALKRGMTIAIGAAALQGVVAIAIIGLIGLVIDGTRREVTGAVTAIQLASFAMMAAFGGWLVWRKGRALATLLRAGSGRGASLSAASAVACDHVHLPSAEDTRRWSRADMGVAVLAAGLRPCAGAILILVFTLSQGILWAGALAVAAMSVGTALTTSGIAGAAVFMKQLAVRFASGSDRRGLIAVRAIEFIAALAIAALGLLLLSGLWATIGGA
jgi:ABC-type nickel/cobalt efflux system permease component RcnA